jgi:hypothetical protein
MFKLFQAKSPEIEVDGRTIIADISGMLVSSVAMHLISSEGMDMVHPQAWYPMQTWLNIYRKIQENLGDDTLYSIGRRIPYTADFPDDQMNDVPSALAAIDVSYQNSHRGGEIGHYKFIERGRDDYEIHADTPYHNEFNLGIISALVERYRGRMQFHVGYKVPARNPEEDNACVFEIIRM